MSKRLEEVPADLVGELGRRQLNATLHQRHLIREAARIRRHVQNRAYAALSLPAPACPCADCQAWRNRPPASGRPS